MSDNKQSKHSKNDIEVTASLITAGEAYTAEEERLAAEQMRLKRIDKWAVAYGDDDIKRPLDSLESLRNTIAVNGVLQSCLRQKARVIAGLGYRIAESPYFEKKIDEKEKSALNEWVRTVFYPSFSTVMYRMRVDYEDFGQGLLLIDENIIPTKNRSGREITRVRHLNRLNAQQLNSRKIKIQIPGGGEKEISDPMDVKFPRWVLGVGDAKTYARTFGDPRFIHKYTGETQSTSWGVQNGVLMDGPSVIALTEYDSRDEASGFPLWFSEKKSCDVVWEISRYEWGHFRKNCLPNLVAIVPKVKSTSGKTIREQFQELLRETAIQRAEGADFRKVITIEYTENFLRNQGKLQFLIHEIKSPDPDKFLELEKRKNQLIAISTLFPPSLIHADTGALGSGKDKEAEIKRFKEFVADPEQDRINTEILDQIILHGTNFETVILRLESIDTADPNGEVDRADKWDKIRSLTLAEKREKIGLDHPLSENDADNAALGQIMILGAQDNPVTPDVLLKQLDNAMLILDGMDQEQPVENQVEPESEPEQKEQRLVTAMADMIEGSPTPAQVRMVLQGIRDKVLPAARELL